MFDRIVQRLLDLKQLGSKAKVMEIDGKKKRQSRWGAIKIFFYYINIILAKGQNNHRTHLWGTKER